MRAKATLATVPLTVGLAVLVAGCANSSPSAALGGQQSSTPSPPSLTLASTVVGTATLHITAADSGRTFAVATGARITIELAPEAGSYDPPTADNPAVLREDDHHGGYPANTPAVADFTAIGPGSTRISSQTDLACLHSTPRCLPPQREFNATIVVR
jgi:hypothetical protein